ncbi:alpha-hydroxy-acid oxidizing protein [Polaromonas sp. P1(28)-8]|nr:alpha-hydroxy-acid oxidizing protein [Polaromonas sp. P1(28)-8]
MFDAIESGVEDELGLQRNVEAFSKHVLYPRQMLDVRLRSQKTTLFGQSYSTPIGIAPTGLAGMFRHGAESMLAEAAERCNVPYILSGACIEEMEQVIAIAPERIWFQIYAAKNTRVTSDLMRRAEQAGVNTLVLTVDTPVLPKRERDMRNGFGLPLRPSPLLFLESLLHPRWIAHYFYHGGLPLMKTWARYLPDRTSPAETFSYFREQSPSVQTWRDLEAFRMLWKGRLVVKGLQHPDDAISGGLWCGWDHRF